MYCIYSNPVNNQGGTPNKISDPWAFSRVDCYDIPISTTTNTSTLPQYIQLITSTDTPSRSFYLDQRINYGELLIFSVIFILVLITITFKIGSILKR
jgi:hypothetical protein